jgi:hypothetical protein
MFQTLYINDNIEGMGRALFQSFPALRHGMFTKTVSLRDRNKNIAITGHLLCRVCSWAMWLFF